MAERIYQQQSSSKDEIPKRDTMYHLIRVYLFTTKLRHLYFQNILSNTHLLHI